MALEKLEEHFTKYEVARILGARALQLAMDAPVLLKIEKEKLEEINYDVLKIAEMEFEEGVLPITVKRPFPEKVEEKIKRKSKEEVEKIEKEKEKIRVEQKEKREEADDRKVEEKEKEEEEEILEEGEIMELAKPEDEFEEGEKGEEEGV